MTVNDVVKGLSLEVICGDTQRDVNGCYIGDLLSWVMSHAQSGEIWITIMSNINVVAVASLTDVSCVIICEDVELDSGVAETAQQKDVCILKSKSSVFETASELAKLLN